MKKQPKPQPRKIQDARVLVYGLPSRPGTRRNIGGVRAA